MSFLWCRLRRWKARMWFVWLRIQPLWLAHCTLYMSRRSVLICPLLLIKTRRLIITYCCIIKILWECGLVLLLQTRGSNWYIFRYYTGNARRYYIIGYLVFFRYYRLFFMYMLITSQTLFFALFTYFGSGWLTYFHFLFLFVYSIHVTLISYKLVNS